MPDLLYPRKTSNCKILAWAVWIGALAVFITLLALEISKAVELAKNPSASVEEVVEIPMKLPSFVVCPWDDEGASATFPTENQTCETGYINQPDIDCGVTPLTLQAFQTNGSITTYRPCVMFNPNKLVSMKFNFDEVVMFHRITFPEGSAGLGTSVRAAYMFPTDLTKDQLTSQFLAATKTLDSSKNPLERFGFISLRQANVASLTKSIREDINGKSKVAWSLQTLPSPTAPDLATELNVTDFVYVALNVANFRVLKTKEVNPLTAETVIALIGGLWIYVPFFFALFFAYDEDKKVYYYRGVRGTISAIVTGSVTIKKVGKDMQDVTSVKL